MNPRLTIDELEMLNPYELGKLLFDEVCKDSTDVQYIKDLLDVGCPIDSRCGNSWIALRWAVWHGKHEVAEFLISNGAEINDRDDEGRTALHLAAHYGHLEMVEFLLSKGADIQVRDKYGWSAWYLAAKEIKEKVPELKP